MANREYLQLDISDIRMFVTTVAVTPIEHATCIAEVSHGSAAVLCRTVVQLYSFSR
jgi:hypothetical protein